MQREEYRFWVSENRVLRKIQGPNRQKEKRIKEKIL
jgi:hypothetical protein